MPLITRRIPHHTQPQGAARVNWKHELLKNCHAVFSGTHLYTRDGAVYTAARLGVSKSGVYGSIQGPYIAGLDTDYISVFACVTRPVNAANYQSYTSFGYYIDISNNQLFQFGEWEALTINAVNFRTNGGDALTYNESFPLQEAVFEMYGDHLTPYTSLSKNGVIVRSGLRSGGARFADTRKRVSFTSCNWGFFFGGTTSDQVLSSSRNIKLQENPWQIFEPRPQNIFISDAAGDITVAAADTGSGADTVSIVIAGAAAGDTGAGVETAAIFAALTGADSGVGVEATSTLATLSAAETGAGTETQSVVQALTLSAADSGAGTETQGVTVLTLVSASDAATGSDAGVVHANLTALDSATGAETTQTHVTLAASEIAVSAEATATSAALSAAETATGAEAASTIQVADVIAVSALDSGAGTETASVSSVLVRPASAAARSAQPKAPLWAYEEPEESIPTGDDVDRAASADINVELADLLVQSNKLRPQGTLSLPLRAQTEAVSLPLGRGAQQVEPLAAAVYLDDEEDVILLAMLASACYPFAGRGIHLGG